MPRQLAAPTALALLLSLVLPTGLSTPASGLVAAARPYGPAISAPVEDSYYPDKGDPTVDALQYSLNLTWHRHLGVLSGRTVLILRTTRVDDALRLDLSHRFRVRRVRVDAQPTQFTHDGDHLLIDRAVEEGEQLWVEVVYHGKPGPARGPSSRADIAKVGMRVTEDGRLWTMQEPYGAFTWYPVNDHPSDKALYSVQVQTPARWIGIANGDLVYRRTAYGRTLTRWASRDPMPSYLTTLAVGPYRRYRQTGPNGLPMTYWVPRGRPQFVKPLLRTPAAMRWLEERLGRYPFDRVGIVLTPGGSAMETQNLVTLGVRTYRRGGFHVRSTVVHELAHQWWGDTVTPSQWRDVWMNEGMATYLHTRWEDDHSDRPETRWRRVVHDWAVIDPWLRDAYGPPGAYHRDAFGEGNVYWSVSLMWDRLRRRLGDETFDRLIRRWPQTHAYSNAGRDELVAWWSAQSAQDLKPFFDRWLDSTESPA